MSQIGKNIKKIRNVQSLSQQAFADLFDLSRGNISSYEEFRAEPKIETIIKIANYFSIPLTDFIEKDLSINELLHYNTELVLEPEKLKISQQLQKIPYVPALYISDFVTNYNDNSFIQNLPHITIPTNIKSYLIAIEVDNQDTLPVGLDARNGDILIYEYINKENIHRITDKFGMMISSAGLNFGIFKQKENNLVCLSLNDFVSYPFILDSKNEYCILRATYQQIS